MTPSSIVGLLGAAMFIAAAGRFVLRGLNLEPRARIAAVALLLGAGWVPVDGLPLAGYVRGVIGDLSISTMLFLGAVLASYVLGRRLIETGELAVWFAAIIAAALYLYPMALGLGDFDPYALGYGSFALAGVLLAVSLGAWHVNRLWVVASILAAVAAYLLQLLESANLWDYLIDPVLAGCAVFWWARRGG